MDARSEWQRLGSGLGVWVWLPVLAFLLLFIVIAGTPGADCDGIADDHSGSEALTLTVAIAASLCALVAAWSRVAALRRGAGVAPWQIVAALVALGLIGLAGTLIDLGGNVDFIWGLGVVGVLATAAALLALVLAWMGRRGPDEVGLLLPAYLLGAAVFVYPGFGLLAIALKSGGLC
jgi:hypothetical protein